MIFEFVFITVFLLFAFLLLSFKKISPPIFLSVVIGLVIRLIVCILFKNIQNYDTISWDLVAHPTASLKNIYPGLASEHAPYFPFLIYLYALGELFHLNSVWVSKFTFVFIDTAIIYCVYLLSGKNKQSAALYAVNPISIFITEIHGQIDSLPILFLLLAIYLFKKKQTIISFLILSCAIGAKTWPLIFTLPFIKRATIRHTLILAVMPVILIVLYSIFFQVNPLNILYTVAKHRGAIGNWGTGFLAVKLAANQDIRFVLHGASFLFLCIFLLYSWKIRAKNILSELMMLFLFFLSFSPTFGIQWLIWPIPFLVMLKPKLSNLFITLATIYIGINYLPWILIPCPFCSSPAFSYLSLSIMILVWLTTIAMFFVEQFREQTTSTNPSVVITSRHGD